MFYLLSCQVCTPDLQQSLRVPGLGNWAGLGPGPFLHGVHPLGHSHLPLPDGGTAPRGEHGTWAMGVADSQCPFLCDPLRVPGLLSLYKRQECAICKQG